MSKKLFFAAVFCFAALSVAVFPAFAQSRQQYALVIGIGNYMDRNISSLANPVNDAADVAATLQKIGYNVTLKTNIRLRDMLDAVHAFTGELMRSPETEGLFWFAGHGLSVRGVHYLLPVDANPDNDSMIMRSSYSVDDIMDEIGKARNKTNLIVIDACRNTLLPGANRNVGTRGLTVLSADDYRVSGNKIVYSTMAGSTAADGVPGSRNSPFAQAFIANIGKPEIFDDVFLDIANETMRLTRGEQQPYAMGSFAVKSYSISPVRPAPVPVAAEPIAQTPSPLHAQNPTPRIRPEQPIRASNDFTLDGRTLMNLSASPTMAIGNPTPFGGSITYTFHEHHGEYRKGFFIPNSYFVSAETQGYTHEFVNYENYGDYDYNSHGMNGRQSFFGGIFSLGAMYKIRLDSAQRFIAGVGIDFSLLGLKHDTSIKYISENRDIKNFRDESFTIDPGMRAHMSVGFRFTPLVSLDAGFIFGGFWGHDEYHQLKIKDNDADYHIYIGDNNEENRNRNNAVLKAQLSLSFWFPR